nr:MarR family winged helix-turn-helix transcriptional regulator [Cohaesibacter marisflavi]
MQSAALIQRLSSLLQETTKRLLKFHDLTYMEFDALAALRSQKPGATMTPTELYDALLISSGGLTKVLKSLKSKGFITRSYSQKDARQKLVLLTDKGRAKLSEIMPQIAANAETLLQNGFESPEACTAFADDLKRIIQTAEREINQQGR